MTRSVSEAWRAQIQSGGGAGGIVSSAESIESACVNRGAGVEVESRRQRALPCTRLPRAPPHLLPTLKTAVGEPLSSILHCVIFF